MPDGWNVGVSTSAAVVLSPNISCDGFHRPAKTRVQTHAHLDHRDGFATSKGHGAIVCLSGTRDLMIAELNADLPYRGNFIALEPGEEFGLEDGFVQLFDSHHMLGSAQVLVQGRDGYRTGYSGDFGWPTTPIEVDELVVDGTCSPATIRNYSQEDAEEAFAELAVSRVRTGPVVTYADLESVYRGISVLARFDDWPVIVDEKISRYSETYARHGLPVPQLLTLGTEEAESAMGENRYFLFRTKGAGRIDYGDAATYLSLISFYTTPDNPVAEITGNYFQVGISNHADFEQTVSYVEGTGAAKVLVDNYRGRRAGELALALEERLSVETSFELERPPKLGVR